MSLGARQDLFSASKMHFSARALSSVDALWKIAYYDTTFTAWEDPLSRIAIVC
jgi:hypothetical protein